MSYENLNITKMLATHCAVCSRPLRDAVSVELGIGPDCREKYGYNSAVNEENRAQANKLVYLIADKQEGIDVAVAVRELRSLGFATLAQKIATRLFQVRIDKTEQAYRVTGPYTETAVVALRSIPGRRWNKELGANEVPLAARSALWAALKRAYPGYDCLGPDGNFFSIPNTLVRA